MSNSCGSHNISYAALSHLEGGVYYTAGLEGAISPGSLNRRQTLIQEYERSFKDLDQCPSRSNSTTSCLLSPMPPTRGWRGFLQQDVAKDWMLEAQLMLLTIATGIQDATTFKSYKIFATKQTGNTLILALYALKHPVHNPSAAASVSISIISFILGACIFSHLARRQGKAGRRRGWLINTSFLQTLLVLIATSIRYCNPEQKSGSAAWAAIALLSFAGSGQIAMAFGAGLPELNTTMITGCLVQLCSDPNLLKKNNRTRNRLVLFYLSLLVGGFIGAAVCRQDAVLGLLLTTMIKALVGSSFLFNPGIMQMPFVEVTEKHEAGIGAATPVRKALWADS